MLPPSHWIGSSGMFPNLGVASRYLEGLHKRRRSPQFWNTGPESAPGNVWIGVGVCKLCNRMGSQNCPATIIATSSPLCCVSWTISQILLHGSWSPQHMHPLVTANWSLALQRYLTYLILLPWQVPNLTSHSGCHAPLAQLHLGMTTWYAPPHVLIHSPKD